MLKDPISKSEFARRAGVSAAAVTKACRGPLLAAFDGKRLDANHADAVAYSKKHARAKTPQPAPGVDPLYSEAVASGKRTANALREVLNIGSERAKKIVAMMEATIGLEGDRKSYGPPPADAESSPRTTSGVERARQTKKDHALKSLAEGKTLHEVPEDIEAFADMTLREIIERFGTDVAFLDWLKATKAIEDINKKRLDNAEARGLLVSRELVRVGVIEVFNSAHLRLMTDGAKSITAGVISKHLSRSELADIESFVSDILGSFITPVKNKIKRSLKSG